MSEVLHAFSRCAPAFAMLFAVLSVNLLPLRRDRAALRLCCSAAALLLLILTVLLIPEKGPGTLPGHALYYYAIYLGIGLTLVVCCEGSIYEAAYVTAIGQLWQHLLYSLSSIVFTLLEMTGHPVNHSAPAVTLAVFFVYFIAYLTMRLVLSRVFRNLISLQGYTSILLACLLLPIPLTVMNLLITSLPQEPQNLLYFRIYSVLIVFAAYFMLISVQHTKVARLEAENIRQSNLRQKERYELQKELIDRVNVRAHDLKKQLSRMEAGALYDRGAMEEIRRELNEYEQFVNSGNGTLDVILTDAAVRCREAGIRFSCLVDGRELAFLDTIDLYAIFGNLLDNAITAASAVRDPENRILSLKMNPVGELLYFHMFNTYENDLRFQGEFPRTTKSDAENHGFGMKSVSLSLKKYGGEMLISAENQVFNVNFMLKKP